MPTTKKDDGDDKLVKVNIVVPFEYSHPDGTVEKLTPGTWEVSEEMANNWYLLAHTDKAPQVAPAPGTPEAAHLAFRRQTKSRLLQAAAELDDAPPAAMAGQDPSAVEIEAAKQELAAPASGIGQTSQQVQEAYEEAAEKARIAAREESDDDEDDDSETDKEGKPRVRRERVQPKK